MRTAIVKVLISLALGSVSTPVFAANPGLGEDCGDGGTCVASGVCVDGKCCSSQCNGCETCKPSGDGCLLRRESSPPRANCDKSVGYLCNGASSPCPTDCPTYPCAKGFYCTRDDFGGTCEMLLEQGASCSQQCGKETKCTACKSGNCVDGVCCNSECFGACSACTKDLKGDHSDDGVCGNIAADHFAREEDKRQWDAGGRDAGPPHECVGLAPGTCGFNGQCDGRGACEYYGSDTECAHIVCVSDQTLKFHCDGRGACQPEPDWPQCCPNGQCPLFHCAENESCDAGNMCEAGYCADASTCEAGHCSSTNDAGACDGGSCAPSKCTGGGTAVINSLGEERSCRGFKCVDGGCPQDCRDNDDCTGSNRCFRGQCVNPKTLGLAPSPCAVARPGSSNSSETTLLWCSLSALAAALALARRSRNNA